MGSIEQGGISPSGETLQDSSPHRLSGGNLGLTRRGFLSLVTALAVAAGFRITSAGAEDQPGITPTLEVAGVQAGGVEPNVAEAPTPPEASSESIAASLKEVYGIDPLIWEDVDKKGNKVTRLFAVVGTPTLPLRAADYSEDISVNLSPGSVHTDITPGMTREQAIKKIMHDEDIPQILVLPGQTSHTSYIGVGRVGTPLGRVHWAYPDWVIKPDSYPNAIVFFYEETDNTSKYVLDAQREEDLYRTAFGFDLAQAIKMFHSPEVPPNTIVYPDETRDDAKEALAGKLGLLIKPVTFAKEPTPPSA